MADLLYPAKSIANDEVLRVWSVQVKRLVALEYTNFRKVTAESPKKLFGIPSSLAYLFEVEKAWKGIQATVRSREGKVYIQLIKDELAKLSQLRTLISEHNSPLMPSGGRPVRYVAPSPTPDSSSGSRPVRHIYADDTIDEEIDEEEETPIIDDSNTTIDLTQSVDQGSGLSPTMIGVGLGAAALIAFALLKR